MKSLHLKNCIHQRISTLKRTRQMIHCQFPDFSSLFVILLDKMSANFEFLLVNIHNEFLFSVVETQRKFIIYLFLRGVSTKLNKYIVLTLQTYKKLKYT